MIEIIQFSTEPMLEENVNENEEIKLLENVQNSIFEKENMKIFTDAKKIPQINMNNKSIKDTAEEILNTYIKKYEKFNC